MGLLWLPLILLLPFGKVQADFKTIQLDRWSLAAFVITCEPERLTLFLSIWNHVWPALPFNIIQGINNSAVRGRGLTQTYFNLYQECLPYCADLLMILEDDAVPFPEDVQGNQWPDLLKRAWQQKPRQSQFVLLGGHALKGRQKQACVQRGEASLYNHITTGSFGFMLLDKFFGTYAFMLNMSLVKGISRIYASNLRTNKHAALSPDVSWHGLLKRHKAVAPCPLIIDHLPGYSMTWHRKRHDKWMGHKRWWDSNFQSRDTREIWQRLLAPPPAPDPNRSLALVPWAFVHIPKTGGASFIRHFQKQHASAGFWPPTEQGNEYCLPWVLKKNSGRKVAVLTLFRSPRAHVMSLFKECYFNNWGRQKTRNTLFPRTQNRTADFLSWLQHFQQQPEARGKEASFNCYHPVNFQTRSLVCPQKPHWLLPTIPTRPSLEQARQKLHSLTWFGIQEFWTASFCLLYAQQPNSPQLKQCQCQQNLSSSSPHKKFPHVTHGPQDRQISSTIPLPSSKLTWMDRHIIDLDRQLFVEILSSFLTRVVETEHHLGFQILCPEVIETVEPTWTYLNFSWIAFLKSARRSIL